jgi:hypothetical protein
MSPDLLRGTSKLICGALDVDVKALNNIGLNPYSHYITAPLIPTRAHMNWPHQEDYVSASELRTQIRTGKNNLELQMND